MRARLHGARKYVEREGGVENFPAGYRSRSSTREALNWSRAKKRERTCIGMIEEEGAEEEGRRKRLLERGRRARGMGQTRSRAEGKKAPAGSRGCSSLPRYLLFCGLNKKSALITLGR